MDSDRPLPHLAHYPRLDRERLPDEEAQLINTHVADCDECREKLELMNAVGDALTSGPGASTNR